MIIRKAYKYRLKQCVEVLRLFAQTAGCCRLVWNRALALQKHRLDNGVKALSYGELCQELAQWKKDPKLFFLNDVPSQPLQQVLKNLSRAIREAFLKKKGFPHFKKKFKNDSFRYPQGCKIKGNRIFLPKIGFVSFFHSINPKGKIKNVTLSKQGKHWYTSVQTEYEVKEPKHPSSEEVGIDLGVCRFATLSHGSFYEPLNSFKNKAHKLAIEQRKLKRKKKFSANWKRQKMRVAAIHIKIANARRDYLHKISTEISKNHAVIMIEDLKVSNMSRTAKGTEEDPGKNVKQKSGLNRSILDQGWYEFRRQLEYKQQWRGGKVIAVPPQYTSQECPLCHYVCSENRKTQSLFQCVKCSYTAHADLVGAKNVLAIGQIVAACESNLMRDRKPRTSRNPRGMSAPELIQESSSV
jgi:putative transposase